MTESRQSDNPHGKYTCEETERQMRDWITIILGLLLVVAYQAGRRAG